MKHDREKITALVSELNSSFSLLQDLAQMEKGHFCSDPHRIASAKYNLLVAIEAMIYIGNHLISKNRLRVPENYGDVFRVLAEYGFLPFEYADTLVKMAQFRNRLVHLYWQVDTDKLFSIVCNNISDIQRFFIF